MADYQGIFSSGGGGVQTIGAGTNIVVDNTNPSNPVVSVTGVALASHTHDAAAIITGTIATARLGSGTANNTTFLRGDQTWATVSGGVAGFIGSQNTASPNNTVNASRLLVDAVSTNADAVIQPKGSGAFLAQLPDSTATGGNKRGTYAVDFQRDRTANTQVASGSYATIVNGYRNIASGNWSTVVNGTINTASGSSSFIGGGDNNTASGNNSAIVGGNGNTAGLYSFVGGGQSNSCNFGYSVISGGQTNSVGSSYATVSGGTANAANSQYSVVAGGNNNGSYNTYAAVGGGYSNYAFGISSVVSGGYSNYAMSDYSTVSGGQSNTAQNGFWTTVSGGYNNKIGNTSTSSSSNIGGGQSNQIDGINSTIVGGANNIINGSFCAILGGNLNYVVNGVQYATAKGYGASARDFGANSFANYYYSTVGDAQATDIVLSARTTNGTPATLGMSGSNVGVIIPDRTAATFSIFITCRQTGTSNVGGWEITGLIENTAGTLTAYNVSTNLIHRSVGTWNATAVANSGTGRLDVQVTGSAATVQWVATARVTFSTIV